MSYIQFVYQWRTVSAGCWMDTWIIQQGINHYIVTEVIGEQMFPGGCPYYSGGSWAPGRRTAIWNGGAVTTEWAGNELLPDKGAAAEEMKSPPQQKTQRMNGGVHKHTLSRIIFTFSRIKRIKTFQPILAFERKLHEITHSWSLPVQPVCCPSSSRFVTTSERWSFSGGSRCWGIWLRSGNYDCYFQSQQNAARVYYFRERQH